MFSPLSRIVSTAQRCARVAITNGRLRLLPLLLLLPIGQASAQLMVHPTRIVLEGNQRSAQLEIINNTNQPATYQLSLVNRRMDANGGFSDIDTAAKGELFAEEMLRYSPRRINLAPGAGQVVRVMVRKPAGLSSGEYRSHLLFAQKLETSAASRELNDEPSDGFGISMIPLVGVSIPVIIRHGQTAATVSLSNVALSRGATGAPVVSLDMHRAGSQSVYGDLIFNFTPAGGIPREIGRAGGVAVYTPNAVRHVALQLDTPKETALAHGTLTVVYQSRPDEGGGVLAEASLILP